MQSRLSNLIGGLGMVAIGLAFAIGALGYRFGNAAMIGPGYFPFVLGAIAAVLGAFIALSPPRADDAGTARQTLRPIVSVFAGIILFALIIAPFGFVPAVFVAVAIAAIGDDNARPLGVLVLAVVVTVLAWLIFPVGLNLPYELFRVPL